MPRSGETAAAVVHPTQRSRLRYLALRLAQMIPTLALILLVAFLLLDLAPGDMAQVMAGESGGASPEYLAHLRQSFGLDQSLIERFLHYLVRVLGGDLGFSYRNNMPVSSLLLSRLPATLLLTGTSVAISVVLGLAGGIASATWRGRWPDHAISFLALTVYATPVFLGGVGLILLLGVALPLLPVGGFVAVQGIRTHWQYASSVAAHLVLPALTLGTAYGAIFVRFTRGAVLEVQGADFIRTARAKGLSPARTVWRHTLRNALLPLVTIVGTHTASMLGGAILVEMVFSWPGLGRLAHEALVQRDYNLLAGLVICSGVLVMFINLIIDLIYVRLDPRVGIAR